MIKSSTLNKNDKLDSDPKIDDNHYKFESNLTKEQFEFWGYQPDFGDENYQKEIYISKRRIKHIEPSLFDGFSKLTALDLSSNQLIEIGDHLFSGLKNLTLSLIEFIT
jgi:hypothetical protein